MDAAPYTTEQPPHVDQAWVLLLDSLHGLAEALQLLHLELELLLVDVHRLELAAVIRHPALRCQVCCVQQMRGTRTLPSLQ